MATTRTARRNYGGRVKTRVLGSTGDRNPLEYGGGIVYKTQHGAQWEFWDGPGNDDIRPTTRYSVYRVDVPDDVFGYHSWANVADLASFIGASELRKLGKSRRVMDRVAALEAIVEYYGPNELDQYPMVLTAKDLRARWRKHV